MVLLLVLFLFSTTNTVTSCLIDNGTFFSVLIFSFVPSSSPPESTGALYAVKGTLIHTYGTKCLHVTLNFRHNFFWDFVVPEAILPILGADFLSHYKFLVLLHKRLIDPETQLWHSASLSWF